MTIKLTGAQIGLLNEWVGAVGSQPVVGKEQMRLLLFINTVTQRFGPAMQAFQSARQQIVKDHGTPVDDEPDKVQLDDDGIKAMTDLLNTQFDLQAETVPFDALVGTGLTVADAAPVAWIFKE